MRFVCDGFIEDAQSARQKKGKKFFFSIFSLLVFMFGTVQLGPTSVHVVCFFCFSAIMQNLFEMIMDSGMEHGSLKREDSHINEIMT